MSNLLTIQEKSLVDIADSIRDNSKKDPETILVRSSNVYTMREYLCQSRVLQRPNGLVFQAQGRHVQEPHEKRRFYIIMNKQENEI